MPGSRISIFVQPRYDRDATRKWDALHHDVFGPEGVGERKNRTLDLPDRQWWTFVSARRPGNDKEGSLAVDVAFEFWIDRDLAGDLLAGWSRCGLRFLTHSARLRNLGERFFHLASFGAGGQQPN